MTNELNARAPLTITSFRGMKKVRDIGMLQPNEFDHLENVRRTVAGTYCPRPGMEAVGELESTIYGAAVIDGIFDGGDAGWRPEPPLPPPVSTPPPGPTVPATPTTNRIDFLAVVANEDAQFALGAMSHIKDANAATYMEVNTTPQNEAEIRFSITAPAIADDLFIASLVLHLIPANTGATVLTYPPCWLNGLYGYLSEWKTGIVDAQEFTLNILRPGGGPWYGRDLKNATLEIGVYVVFNFGTDPQPRFSEAWLTYTT